MEAVSARMNRKDFQDKQVLGTFTVLSNLKPNIFTCKTLELADKDNARKVSCIPEGKCKVVKRTSAKYGQHFHITNVPGRYMILIQVCNYYTDLLG
jgi:hypothetical protein